MKIENYYLNLEKISTLEKEEKEVIHRYYQDMLHHFHDGRTTIAQSLFLTLMNYDCLIDVRDKKLSKILDES
jgi:hypothetical protein